MEVGRDNTTPRPSGVLQKSRQTYPKGVMCYSWTHSTCKVSTTTVTATSTVQPSTTITSTSTSSTTIYPSVRISMQTLAAFGPRRHCNVTPHTTALAYKCSSPALALMILLPLSSWRPIHSGLGIDISMLFPNLETMPQCHLKYTDAVGLIGVNHHHNDIYHDDDSIRTSSDSPPCSVIMTC